MSAIDESVSASVHAMAGVRERGLRSVIDEAGAAAHSGPEIQIYGHVLRREVGGRYVPKNIFFIIFNYL